MMTRSTIITAAMLRKAGACRRLLAKLAAEWPDGAPVTVEIVTRAIDLGADLHWAVNKLLSAPARRAYDEATAPAQRACDEATAPAQRAYDEATVPARRAYDEAMAQAQRAYDEATAQARRAHGEAMIAAFVTAWNKQEREVL